MTHTDFSAIFLREEELAAGRDRRGNFDAQHSLRRWQSPSTRPLLDDHIFREHPEFAASLEWPKGARFAAVLTHDVDGIRDHCPIQLRRTIARHFHNAKTPTAKLASLLSLSGLRHRPSPMDLLTPWMEVETKADFRSTFFLFAGNTTDRHLRDLSYRWEDPMPFEGKTQSVAEVFRQVSQQGWEIGLHGSIASATTPGVLANQRTDIEATLATKVVSGRQHNLQFDPTKTPKLIAEAGLEIDSTLGSNRDVFFRTGSSYPTPLWEPASRSWLPVWEIPLILHDGAMLRDDNLDLTPDAAITVGKAIIDRVAAVRGVVTLLWHPENLVRPGYMEVYRALLEHIRNSEGWGTTCREAVAWWMESGNAAKHREVLKNFSIDLPSPDLRSKPF